jgi:hypothetical protein
MEAYWRRFRPIPGRWWYKITRERKGNFDNVLRREQQTTDRTAAATAIIEDSNTVNIALSSRHVYTPSKTSHHQHNIDSRNTQGLYFIFNFKCLIL